VVPLAVCLDRQVLRTRHVPAADVARQHAAITAALPDLAGEGHAAVVLLPAAGVDRLVAGGQGLVVDSVDAGQRPGAGY
jgi:hypothetical protein